jgi:hypothetical protein
MVLELLFLFYNGADLVVEDLTYLGRLPLRGQVHFLQGFRDSLRLRTYFGFNSYFSLQNMKRTSLDLFVFLQDYSLFLR